MRGLIASSVQCDYSEVTYCCIINSYADDIVLVSNHWNAKNNLDLALRRLELASVLLGLKVNLKKTKAMAWNHSNSFPSYNYTVYQNKIEWVRTFKYLGITSMTICHLLST